MLDPSSNEASFYFKDRGIVQEMENQSLKLMQDIVRKLKVIIREYQSLNLPGQFEVFFYKHFPYNHFLIVDGSSNHGQMLVAHYLYGINRADSPVLEIIKSKNRSLFRRYWQSYNMLITGAKKINCRRLTFI